MTNIQSDSDSITQFYFQQANVRGALVKLSNSFVESLNGHDYPVSVHQILGEGLAAATLMSTHLKTPSRLSLQANGNGNGPIKLLIAESTLHVPTAKRDAQNNALPHQTIRAFARCDEAPDASLNTSNKTLPLSNMLGKARLAITIEPDNAQRYQGIVDATESKLENNLETYFKQSEQLATTIRLTTNNTCATGLLLQCLPTTYAKNIEQTDTIWGELEILTRSIRDDELLNLSPPEILRRLYHQHDYIHTAAQPIEFNCTCSMQRTGAALLQLDAHEIHQILHEDGEIVLDCEFCSTRYRFNQTTIDQLSLNQPITRH